MDNERQEKFNLSSPRESEFDKLQSSISNTNKLKTWIAHNNVNKDIIIIPENATSPSGDRYDNRGSPLLIAVELDMPAACAALLEAGADINYVHPSEHGNSPFLRCVEMGLEDCLAVFLSQPMLDVDVVTKEYKLVLGQHIPQYEAGGRSALFLAIEALHPGIVQMLLEDDRCRGLLGKRDSFGRTPIQAAFEVLALRREGGSAQDLATQTCRLLCSYQDEALSQALQAYSMTYDEATDGLKKRNQELRSRCLVAAHAKRQEQREHGLRSWRAHYQQPARHRHSCIYDASFRAEDVLLPKELLAPSAVSKIRTVPHPQPLIPLSLDVLGIVKEPVPGTFSFPLLSEDLCSKLYAELLHYRKVATSHPAFELPLYIRHDGNMGQLEACGFEPILKAIEAIWQPLVSRFMPGKGDCEVYHAFMTQNWVGRDANATFKTHCDKSDLTFNICLHASKGFEGSTVGFFRDRDGLGSGGHCPEDPADRVYTHTHRVGHAVMHDGAQWHRTDAITAGTRASLIVWARRVGGRCTDCSEPLGTASLFCKSCGKQVDNVNHKK